MSGTGGGGGATTAGTLGPGVPLTMVYPIMANMLPRKNAWWCPLDRLAGWPGRLRSIALREDLHGVLANAGQGLDTAILPVRGRLKAGTQTNSAVVHMEQGITPPDAEDRYDFKRLPLPEDKLHKLIVLRGVLREDGALEGLQVHQGLLPLMDEAARLAFSKWKFKPATRGGKAIPVDILVGIPSDPPPARPPN